MWICSDHLFQSLLRPGRSLPIVQNRVSVVIWKKDLLHKYLKISWQKYWYDNLFLFEIWNLLQVVQFQHWSATEPQRHDTSSYFPDGFRTHYLLVTSLCLHLLGKDLPAFVPSLRFMLLFRWQQWCGWLLHRRWLWRRWFTGCRSRWGELDSSKRLVLAVKFDLCSLVLKCFLMASFSF